LILVDFQHTGTRREAPPEMKTAANGAVDGGGYLGVFGGGKTCALNCAVKKTYRKIVEEIVCMGRRGKKLKKKKAKSPAGEEKWPKGSSSERTQS